MLRTIHLPVSAILAIPPVKARRPQSVSMAFEAALAEALQAIEQEGLEAFKVRTVH